MDFDNFNLGQEFQGKKQVKSAIGGKVIGITTYRLGKIKKRDKTLFYCVTNLDINRNIEPIF